MADTKLADLTALTTPSGDDILYIVDDPAGTPLDRKIALNNLFTRGTITASAPVLDASQTWNNAAVTFTSFKLNITDTASNAASLLMDLGTGGGTFVSRFSVTRAGVVNATGSITGAGISSTSSGSGVVQLSSLSTYGTHMARDYVVSWGNNATLNGSLDLIFGRRAAANLRLGAADVGATTATVTITIAAPGVVTWSGHSLSTGTPVVFTTTGALPTGIVSGTTYYAVVVDANTFQIASSVANAIAATPTVITTSGTQSGTHTGTRYNITQRLSMQSVTGVTDRLGADLFIQGSQGTGTGAGGSIIFQVAPAGGSGMAQNGLVDALTINSNGFISFASSAAASSFQIAGGQGSAISFSGVSIANTAAVNFSSDGSALGTPDLFLLRDAPNTLALRNGANAQAFRVYNTTDGTNSEYGFMKWNGTTFEIGAEKTGTGNNRNVTIRSNSGILAFNDGNSAAQMTSGQFLFGTRSLTQVINVEMSGYTQMSEMTAPAAPAANGVRIYAVDNGSGKTQLMALFATGAAQQIAIEP